MSPQEKLDFLESLRSRPRMTIGKAFDRLRIHETTMALRRRPPTVEEAIAKMQAIAAQAKLPLPDSLVGGWMKQWENENE